MPSAAAIEDLSAVMDIFVREFCANCEGGTGSVSMRNHTLQNLLVKHMRLYLAVGFLCPPRRQHCKLTFLEQCGAMTRLHVHWEPLRLEAVPSAVALGFARTTERASSLLKGACDPHEVRKIMGDLHENQGASVDFQAFMATWTRILVAGHAPFQERVFLTKGPCGRPISADKPK
ncbi:uncharacterized protein LOC133353903 isoform X1 [Lethenteron reissneri]|uniref:uncharacterized protein LOC133353903 isoform X1 n=1 Tax=Lethenteron reissneri TaxID=7753 RepID=UPI002AB65E97|nr:uncharacterized protein LOC133353903 isoform X1 [Lethenteron reissneri]XP_061426385.1 uncharacterized protein LOC133353903 isoform X1 [Lethenteron reissneri]XP_061426386.1 uncharacterized protein LOC133353903 isoform X1 [Lethenteron reissneri]XP_061426387.1 uncharacterized protein LOC133353903 isoform X1 [Lethenteron reissneri]